MLILGKRMWVLVAQDLVLGLVLGLVGGIFGIGGGLIAIPALVALYGIDQQLAQGTALVMIAPNVLLAFWRYKQRNLIDWSTVALLGVTSIVSTYVCARLALGMSTQGLRLGFAGFLVALAVFLLFGLRADKASEGSSKVWSRPWMGVLGVISGVFSGLFTVGGGLVVAPAVMRFFGVKRQTTAQGLGLATVVPGALVSLYTYAMAGKVNWVMGLPMAVGGLISISWGVALAHILPERVLRLLFCVLLLITACSMF